MTEREKIIELLDEVSGVVIAPTSYGVIADHLIANGVTFATDNNVGDKKEETWEDSKT